MNSPVLFAPRWRLLPLSLCLLLAMGLLLTWWWAPTRQLWDVFDLAAFRTLNGSLDGNELWARIWGVANMRLTDLAVGLTMLLLLIRRGWAFDGPNLRAGLYGYVALLLLMVLIRVGLLAQILGGLDLNRNSPSLVQEGVVRLSALFPEWNRQWHMKDASNQSFPGDHAAVLLLWGMYLWAFADTRKRLYVAALSILFVMPRMISGAHWVTDILVGSIALCLVTVGIGLYTPYIAYAVRALAHLGAPIFRMLEKLPLLARISLISGR